MGLAPKCWSRYFWGNKALVQGLGVSSKNTCLPYFAVFFILFTTFYVFHAKSIFQPRLEVRSTQILVDIYKTPILPSHQDYTYVFQFQYLHTLDYPTLSLFKLYNIDSNTKEFVCLNFNQILTSRQEKYITSKNNKIKVGLHCLANRPYILNGTIPLQSCNNSIDTFKVKCKKMFLS